MNPLLWLAALGVFVLIAVIFYRTGTTKPRPKALPANVNVRLTTHAQQRMIQRGVTLDEIRAVLASPAGQDRDRVERSVRLHGCDDGDRFLKVWVAEPWPSTAEIVVKSTAWNYYKTLTIPCDQIGRVIGRGGSTINNLEVETSTHIKVEHDGTVHISGGDNPSVETARRRIVTVALGHRGRATPV